MKDVVDHFDRSKLKPEDLKFFDKLFENPNPEQGFDKRTHIRDPRNGRVVREQHYRRVCYRDEGGQTMSYYVRDGKRFAENGDELGPDAPVAPKGKPNAANVRLP